MNRIRKIFQDKIEIAYFFNSGATINNWKEDEWIWRWTKDKNIIKRRLKELEQSKHLTIEFITRNETTIYPQTKK